MAIINQYKVTYPVENTSFEHENIYINATSMEKAINLITTEKGKEPLIASRIHDNVLTEPTSETTVTVNVISFYINDEEEEVLIPECLVYPSHLTDVKRGNTIYFTAPSYTFGEEYTEELQGTWELDKWIYNEEEFTDNPYMFTVTYDESINEITVKAKYIKV